MSHAAELFKDIPMILPECKRYFSNIFTPSDEANYDKEFQHCIDNETGEIWRNCFKRIAVVFCGGSRGGSMKVKILDLPLVLRERFTFKVVAL